MLSGQFDWGDLLLKGNKFFVAPLTGDSEASIRLYAGTSVYLGLRGPDKGSVTMSRVRTISRKDQEKTKSHLGILRDCTPNVSHDGARVARMAREMMIQSVLYGDV